MVFAGLKKPQDRADLIVCAPLCRLRRRATAPGRGPPWQRPPDADARAARSLAPAGPPQERDCVSRSLRADRSRHCLDCERRSCRGGRRPRHWPSFFPSANTDLLPVKTRPIGDTSRASVRAPARPRCINHPSHHRTHTHTELTPLRRLLLALPAPSPPPPPQTSNSASECARNECKKKSGARPRRRHAAPPAALKPSPPSAHGWRFE